jgi:membrane peptidoglycan carboxypeptidase
VIAAEDQTFRNHPGYDGRQVDAALRSNGDGNALRGASTLTQQLARLVYTGDERTPQRKLRELLYAVEMEQSLGKERILQLYLALAPWGQQVCGAENAAQRYLGKPANALAPAEAAWLASLLTNPDARLRQTLSTGVDTARTTRIVQAMRPMSARRRRQALAEIALLKPRQDNCLAGVACVDLPSLVRTGG